MEPNIRQLYDNLASMDMLDVKEVPFEQFATKLTDPTKQKQLYDRLAGMPIEGSPYGAAGLAESDFMDKFFSKKKVQSTPGSPEPSVDFSTGSFEPGASAPTATESSTFEPTFAPDPVVPMPPPQPGGDALPSNLIPRPATQDALRPAPVIDQGPVVEYSIKGDEDVRQYAASAPKNRATQEKVESQEATMATPMTEGVESVAKAALIYAEDARRQSDIAASVLEGAYGKDWRNNPAAKQDEYYQKFTAGLTAQGRAFDEYNVATGGYSLTGDEDPVEFGETRRANLPSYEYKRKYDSRTPLREEKRKLDNIAEYGAAANAQQKFATQFLNAKYGEGWMDKMAEIAGLAESNPEIMTEELVAQYSVIAEDPMFDTWKSSLAAQEKGFEEFKAQVEASPKYKEQILKAADAQAKSDMAQAMYGGPELLAQFAGTTATGQTENRAGNWLLRKAAQLAGGALALPRTVGKAFSGDGQGWNVADEMGSIGDELVDQAEVNYPKPSQLGRPLYEKVAEFEGREIVFDSKGKVTSISGGDTPEGFEQRLKDADLASTAKTRFNGATAVTDKVLDAGADLLIYRFLGNGTKIGTASSSFYMNHQAAYQEAAKELKMGADDAAQFAFVSSALMGALEAYVGDIETALAKPGIAQAVQLGRKEALAAAGSMSAAQRAVVSLKPVIKQIAGENSEEILQSVGDGAARIAYNTMTGAELENGMSKDELKETVLVTTLLTAPLAAFGMGGHTETYRRQALLAAAKSPQKFAETLAELEKNGAIAADQVASATQMVERMAKFNESLPAEVTDDQRSHLLALQSYRETKAAEAKNPAVLPAQQQIAAQEVKAADDMAAQVLSDVTAEPVATAEAQVPVETEVEPEVEAEIPPPVAKVADVIVAPEDAPEAVQEKTNTVLAEAVAALEEKGHIVTPEELPAVQEFFVEDVTASPIQQQQEVPVAEVVNAMADEYLEANGIESSPTSSGPFVLKGDTGPAVKPRFTRTKGVDSLKGIVADKTDHRPALKGVLHVDGKMVATDGHVMVVINGGDPALNGKIIDPKTKAEIPGKYPDWEVVIPIDNPFHSQSIPIETLAEALAPITTKKGRNEGGDAVNMELHGQTILVSPTLLYSAIDALAAHGGKNVVIEASTPLRGVIVRADNGNKALVMPRMPGPELEVANTLELAEGPLSDGGIQETITYLKKESMWERMDKEDKAKGREGWGEKAKAERAERDARIKELEDMLKSPPTPVSGNEFGLDEKQAEVYEAELPAIAAKVDALSPQDMVAANAFVAEMGGDIDRVIASVNGSIEEMDRQAFEKLKETNPTVHELFFNELSEETSQTDQATDSRKGQEKKPRPVAARQTQAINSGVVPAQTQDGTPAGTSDAARAAEPDPVRGVEPDPEPVVEYSVYKAYLRGYDDGAIRISYIPDNYTREQFQAWGAGFLAGKRGDVKMDWEEFSASMSPDLPPVPTVVTPEGVALAREIDAITPAQAEAALAGNEAAGAKVLAAAEQIEQAAQQDAVLEDHNVASETAEQIEQRIASVGKAVLVTYGDSVIVTRYEGIEDVLRDMGGVFNPSRGWTFPLSRRAEVALAISRARNPILKETAEMSKGAHGQRVVANAHDTKSHVQARKRKAAIDKGETLQERVATAKELLEVSENEREERVLKTVERLRKAFPGVEVVTDTAEVAAALSSMGLDSSVKGFVKDGVVYINLESAGVDTPLHEFGHVWSAVMKAKKPKLYERGIESIRGSEYEQAVREDERYNKMEDEEILDEALATAIGERGARFQDDGPWQVFKKFLGSMKSAIKGLVGFDPMKMTANEYADMIAAQLLSGNEIMEETSAEIAKLEDDVMFQYGEEDAGAKAQDDLSGATRLEALGYGAKAIRAITSWTRGPEGIWRFRPSREAVQVVAQPNLMEDGDTLPLDRVIASDALYSVDPALRSIPVTFKAIESEDPAVVAQAGITVNLNQVKTAAALQRAIVSQIKAMALDRIGEGDMPAVEDIGASERTVIMGEDNAHAKAEVAGFQGIDLPKGTRFQFGTQTVRDAAVRAAAKQLVEIELREGSVDKATAVPFIAKELGLSDQLVDAMWDEAATRMKKNADWLDIREGKIPGILERMKKNWSRTWARWMGPNKGLPKGIFKEAQKMEREVAAAMYSASKVAGDLDRALKGHPDAVRALAQQAIEGTAEFDHLPVEVAIHAKAMRNMVDALSRKLLLSGAVKKGTVVTIMEGMGIEIAPDATGQIEEIEAVLGKMPSERSPEEVDMVNDFLDQHQQKFGTYMNRSYRAHVYPDWEKRVAPEVVDRARRYFIRELQAEYNELAEKLGKSKSKATAKLAKLEAELDAAKSVAQALATDLELADPNDLAAIDRAKSIQDEMSAITGMSKEDVAALAAVTDTDVLAAAVSQARAIKAAMLKVQDKIDQDDVKVGKRLDEVSGKLANIDDEINAILYRQHDGSEGISSVMGGAKNLSLFIKRKDLSPEILELLGEYRDPTVNFMASVMKMSNVLASQEFLNTMASRYKGVYFFDSSQKPPGNFAQLEAAGAPHLTPLDGWWTTPDILESLKDMREPAVMAPIEKWLVTQVVQRVKLGKTILSPITHARNFWGNTAFMVLNGWNPKSMFDAYVEMAPKFNAGDPTKWRTYAEKLHRLGVLGESVNAGDLETLRKMSGWKPDSGEISDHAKFIEKYILKAPKAIFDASKSAYQAEDNFYRILAFENEKKRYAKAWFGQSFDTLDAQQQSEIEERAAYIVSHVLPTYSYVPKMVKLIQRLPFIGTFVAFPAEATRVAYNNIQLGIEEMKDPRTASMGIRRLAGATLVHAAEIGIIKAAMAAFGYDDEEWKDAEFFVAPFEKTGGLMPLPKDEKGLMGYINLSYTNPYGFLPKMFRAYQAEPKRPMAGNVAAMMGQFAEPFLSPDLTFQTFNQLFMNQDDWGRSIRSKLFEDEMFGTNWLAKENLKSQLGFMAKKLQPGILKSGRDALDIYQQNASPSGKVKNWKNFTLSHLFGLSVQRIDPTVSYKNQMYSLNVQKQEARRVYSAVQKRMNVTYKALKDDASQETLDRKDREAKQLLKENYAVAKAAYAKVLLEAHEVTMALQRLGKTPAECRKELNGWSNREKDAILSGEIDIPLTFERKGKY